MLVAARRVACADDVAIVAVLDGRWLRAPQRRPWREIAIRGVLAALLSGVAFFFIHPARLGVEGESDRHVRELALQRVV